MGREDRSVGTQLVSISPDLIKALVWAESVPVERRGSTAGGQLGGEAGELAPLGLWTWAGVEN